MRGNDEHQGAMFSYISPEQRVPKDHPLRPIREMVNEVLKDLRKTSSTNQKTVVDRNNSL